MDDYERFYNLFVNKQFTYEDFNIWCYKDYIEYMKLKHKNNPQVQQIWPTFEEWFKIWGLTEEEWNFCDKLIHVEE